MSRTILLGFPSLAGPTLLLEFPTLGGLDRHSVVSPTPAQSRHIQFIDGSHPHLRTLFKFVGTVDGITSLRNNIAGSPKHYKTNQTCRRWKSSISESLSLHESYGISMKIFLFEISPQRTSFVWLETEKKNQAFWKGTIIQVLSTHNLCKCLHVLFIAG